MTVAQYLFPVAGSADAQSLSGIRVRPIEDSDLDFLRALYASTRAEEMAAVDWTDAMRERFLAQQFEFQHRYYQEHHAQADFLLLLREGSPIGRLYWRDGAPRRQAAAPRGSSSRPAKPDRLESDAQAKLIDISLVPHERGRGIGSALLAALTMQADRGGLSISLHVEPFNPALRLYSRFGFDVVAHEGVYARMCRPARLQ